MTLSWPQHLEMQHSISLPPLCERKKEPAHLTCPLPDVPAKLGSTFVVKVLM